MSVGSSAVEAAQQAYHGLRALTEGASFVGPSPRHEAGPRLGARNVCVVSEDGTPSLGENMAESVVHLQHHLEQAHA